MRLTTVLLMAALVSGCASSSYLATAEGKFTGALDVRWVENDYFLFVPNIDDPFTFTRKSGGSIRPGPMRTDGGSIPRVLWGIEGYSPWGYAPAYIVHDWLFVAHRCNVEPDNQYSFTDSVTVISEGLKAMMEARPEVRNYFVFDTVVTAVGSPIAKRVWDEGICDPNIRRQLKSLPDKFATPPGELIMTIRY